MATAVDDRTGTKATAKHVRMSASKARVILDLIRNKGVAEALLILEFSDRLAAEPILKVLRSAVANAIHNDELDADELYVSECYADMGTSMRRFRPRARGRAGRIRKQLCHITVVVDRYADDELDAMREQAELKETSGTKTSKKKPAGDDRRRRVAKSKAAAEATDDSRDEETINVDDVQDETQEEEE